MNDIIFNHLQNIWDYYRKSLISFFQEFSASINKIFILAERMSSRLSFYGVQALYSYFLIF